MKLCINCIHHRTFFTSDLCTKTIMYIDPINGNHTHPGARYFRKNTCGITNPKFYEERQTIFERIIKCLSSLMP